MSNIKKEKHCYYSYSTEYRDFTLYYNTLDNEFDVISAEGTYNMNSSDYWNDEGLCKAIKNFKDEVFKEISDHHKKNLVYSGGDFQRMKYYNQLSTESKKWINKYTDEGQLSVMKKRSVS